MRSAQRAFTDLFDPSFVRGFFKALLALAGIVGIGVATFSVESPVAFVVFSIILGFWWASSLILTHDALHYTLTGNKYFDSWFPRLISYPFLWPHGLYSDLHKLHHRMLGCDSRDPENPNYSEQEYKKSSKAKRFYIRNQWFIDLFVMGGFGFIAKHYYLGWKLRGAYPYLKKTMWQDGFATVSVHSMTYLIAIQYGIVGRWVICFLIMERIVGAVHQFRSHVEHFGLSLSANNNFESQIINSRNIETNGLGALYFNHLNYHSIHHAFPSIPFFNIPEAHKRLMKLAQESHLPITLENSYLKTGWRLALSRRSDSLDEVF